MTSHAQPVEVPPSASAAAVGTGTPSLPQIVGTPRRLFPEAEGGTSFQQPPPAAVATTVLPVRPLVEQPTPRRPVGHPSPAGSARAWPNFVPRVELDAELKVLESKLSDMHKRLARQEAAEKQAQTRLEALEGRCEREFATSFEMDTLRRRLDRECLELRDEFREGLDALRERTAARAAFEESRDAQARQLRALEDGLEASGREASKLQQALHAASAHCEHMYATKAQHAEACEALRRDTTALSMGLRQAETKLESHAESHKAHAESSVAHRQRHDDLVLKEKVTSSVLDCVKDSVEKLDQFCRDEYATQESLTRTKTIAETAQQLVEQATAKLDAIIGRVDHDQELLRKTVFAHSNSFKEIHDSLHDVYQVSKTKGDLREFIDRNSERLSVLEAREQEHWEAQQRIAAGLRQAHDDLDGRHKEMHSEMKDHVARLDTEASMTRQYSTSFNFDQMSKAIAFKKSVDTLEHNHKQLYDHISVKRAGDPQDVQ